MSSIFKNENMTIVMCKMFCEIPAFFHASQFMLVTDQIKIHPILDSVCLQIQLTNGKTRQMWRRPTKNRGKHYASWKNQLHYSSIM